MEPELEVSGEPPLLAGLVCQALLAQRFVQGGNVIDQANVTHLQFSGKWHRLYFDWGIVFWRVSADAPESWSDEEQGHSSPCVDIGQEAGIAGLKLLNYRMEPAPDGCVVTFTFEGNKMLTLTNSNDCTTIDVSDPDAVA